MRRLATTERPSYAKALEKRVFPFLMTDGGRQVMHFYSCINFRPG
jgi:hypothetical protein